jgi:hypothetical protein
VKGVESGAKEPVKVVAEPLKDTKSEPPKEVVKSPQETPKSPKKENGETPKSPKKENGKAEVEDKKDKKSDTKSKLAL